MPPPATWEKAQGRRDRQAFPRRTCLRAILLSPPCPPPPKSVLGFASPRPGKTHRVRKPLRADRGRSRARVPSRGNRFPRGPLTRGPRSMPVESSARTYATKMYRVGHAGVVHPHEALTKSVSSASWNPKLEPFWPFFPVIPLGATPPSFGLRRDPRASRSSFLRKRATPRNTSSPAAERGSWRL